MSCAPSLRKVITADARIAIRPPSDWSFKEPDAMKKVEEAGGRKIIRITNSEMSSYVAAVRKVTGIIGEVVPSVILISMRGALPIFRASMQAIDSGYLGKEARLEDNWTERTITRQILVEGPPEHLLRSIGRTEEERRELAWKYGTKKKMRMKAVKVGTSYFLDNLSETMEGCLDTAFRVRGKDRPVRALFLDTSVTGTKLGWFMPQFIDAVKQVSESVKRNMRLVSVILNHDKEGQASKIPMERLGDYLKSSRVDIGVESLITEDSTSLLGASYDEHEIAYEARGEVRAHELPETASIMVGDRLYDINDEKTGSTAALFARIAGDMARTNP